MGEIQNMQNAAGQHINMKSYLKNKEQAQAINIQKQAKPRLNDRTIRGTIALVSPVAKRFRLSRRQKEKQLRYRVGLSIVGLATALSIVGGATYSNVHSSNINENKVSVENQKFDKDTVLSSAENRLMTIVYKDHLSLLDRASVKHIHNDKTNSDTIKVYEEIKSPNAQPIEKFSYTRYNNPEDKYLNSKNTNSAEINSLLDSMIDVYTNENPSYEDLETLHDISSSLNLSSFSLEGTHIVDEAEKDLGYEIDD